MIHSDFLDSKSLILFTDIYTFIPSLISGILTNSDDFNLPVRGY